MIPPSNIQIMICDKPEKINSSIYKEYNGELPEQIIKIHHEYDLGYGTAHLLG